MLELPVVHGVLEEARLSKHAVIRVRGRVRNDGPTHTWACQVGSLATRVRPPSVGLQECMLQVWYTKEWGPP